MTGLLTNAERSYHFDARQFHRMMAAGIFTDQKVELVAGKIYAMTDLPPHTFAVGRLSRGAAGGASAKSVDHPGGKADLNRSLLGTQARHCGTARKRRDLRRPAPATSRRRPAG